MKFCHSVLDTLPEYPTPNIPMCQESTVYNNGTSPYKNRRKSLTPSRRNGQVVGKLAVQVVCTESLVAASVLRASSSHSGGAGTFGRNATLDSARSCGRQRSGDGGWLWGALIPCQLCDRVTVINEPAIMWQELHQREVHDIP
ncbi:hypothetical protein E2C01_044322 [Portunus trituberculatus]|uniref:Uncharacterized protein n=1 Tax=Portunus trituberculatus TaxID=210409 RepID=A0A5B7FZP1_PORTR|nr:hypothetical protein [Portunus trituberculatus]